MEGHLSEDKLHHALNYTLAFEHYKEKGKLITIQGNEYDWCSCCNTSPVTNGGQCSTIQSGLTALQVL